MISLSLDWTGDMTFRNSDGSPSIALHSSTPGIPSPPEALAYAVMGCMAMDVVHVIRKGRHVLEAFSVRFEGERAADAPKRFIAMSILFDLTTSASSAVVDRAITMSRDKYCSVWHTIRPDVNLTTAHVIHPIGGPNASGDV